MIPILTLVITILIGIVVTGATNKITRVAEKVEKLSETSAVDHDRIRTLRVELDSHKIHIDQVTSKCNAHIKNHGS